MVARPEELVKNLFSTDSSTKLKAVREVKNQIIGNKNKKLSYIKLGVVPRIVELLASEIESNNLKVQSAAAVGSFAYGNEDGLKAVVESGGVASLVNALYSQDELVVEAAVRSLKMIYQRSQPLSPCSTQILDATGLQRLVSLVTGSNQQLAEHAAILLARAATAQEQCCAVLAVNGVAALVELLVKGERGCREAAAEALAGMAGVSPEVASAIAADPRAVPFLLKEQLKDMKPWARFSACACLTSICDCLGLGSGVSVECVQKSVLPVLTKLLGEPEVQEQVPQVLYKLIAGSEDLQRTAIDADAISKLAKFLHDDNCSLKLKEGALRALGTLCMPIDREDSRTQLMDCKVWTIIVRALQAPVPGIRAAACSCLRSLSRSQKNLHNNLFDAEVAHNVLRLLQDPEYEVQFMASAALTNMVLHYTPAKEVILRENGIAMLAGFARSMDPMLRLNGVWALQNLLYCKETEVRRGIMSQLSWSDVKVLLEDGEASIQEKVLCLLRNLLYDSADVIDSVLGWSNHQLLEAVQEKLGPGRPSSSVLHEHAWYVFVNTAAHSDVHRDAIMATRVPSYMLHYMASPDRKVRHAVLWLIINLSYCGKDGSEAALSRIQRLKDLSLQEKLQHLQDDDDLDTKERVKTIMDQFKLDSS